MQGHPFVLRLTLVLSLLFLTAICARAQAQGDYVQASVRKVTGSARIYPNSKSAALALKLNTQLEPDNVIETDYNGRVIISITDGSLITILPKSKVILRKFQVPHSARELLEILFGRVIVKIHHAPGKQNPYSLSSPAASIAVRGTEFIVDVQFGGETLVLVREGLVEVWPRGNPDNKRLVSPGDRVTIQPGGRISSVFPTPRRSLETAGQNNGGLSNIFFSAFPDQHMDSLDNPAYATEFKDAQARLLLLPSISSPHHVDEDHVDGGALESRDRPPFDYDVSPQATFFTPIPGSRLVIGGGVSSSYTRMLQLTNVEYENSAFLVQGADSRKLNALDASIIAAYSFGERGRTSVGIGINRLSGDEGLSNDYNSNSSQSTYIDLYRSSARIARTSLTLGLTRRLSASMKIGFYYRHGFNLSDQVNRRYLESDNKLRPDASYSLGGSENISAYSSSSGLGVRFRGSLTKRLFYGIHGSYLYERVRSRHEVWSQGETKYQSIPHPIAYNRYLARRANLGAGLGFLLTSRVLLNVDLAGMRFNDDHPAEEPVILGLISGSFGSVPFYFSDSPNNRQTRSVYAHMAAQANPWRDLILSTSVLKAYNTEIYTNYYNGTRYNGNYKNSATLANVGVGWKLKPNLIAEYLTTLKFGERGPSQAIRLRYTFNLGITNEK
ncbi:MAG TPA: FecR family protein [Blastocatellia bacterium]|nr:FecR family protein [Blastocatellia bacterium]